MNIKSIANTALKKHRYNGVKKGYHGLYKKMLSHISIDTASNMVVCVCGGGVNNWKSKWCKYDNDLSVTSYQIFSRYIGEDINIIPLEILAGIVEPVLTPEPFRAQYGDKNNLGILFQGVAMPETLARNINGACYDKNYAPVDDPLFFIGVNNPEKIILKPSREQSGRGVKLFKYKDGQYIDTEGAVLNQDYLNGAYKQNYLIQEAIKQSPYIASFNPSSVNTLRVATYRSVKTGYINILGAVLRIGSKGKEVDNAHSGGMFVGLDKNNGRVGNKVFDWLGGSATEFNGIDFSKQSFIIPGWDNVCLFAKQVSEKILFGNLIALDIALDENNNPLLIEANVGGFSGWFYQFATGSVFGEFTDEIMEYCWEKYKTTKTSIIIN